MVLVTISYQVGQSHPLVHPIWRTTAAKQIELPTPLFGFRFTLQDINMKYEVIKRPLLPTMPIALTNDPPFRLRLFHSIKAKKLSMESILWINVYEVISCRLLIFWKKLIPLKILNRNELTRMPHPSTYLPHSAKKTKDGHLQQSLDCSSSLLISSLVSIRNTQMEYDGTSDQSQPMCWQPLQDLSLHGMRALFTLKTWECELNLIRTNLQGQCVFLIHKKLPRPKKLPWPNWDKNGSWSSAVFLSPCSLFKTPQNHSQINVLPFLMWQLFTTFHTKFQEGQKRQKLGGKGFSWGNLHCVAVGVRRGGW